MGLILSVLDVISTTPYPSLVAVFASSFYTTVSTYRQVLRGTGEWQLSQLLNLTKFVQFVQANESLAPWRRMLLRLIGFAMVSDLFGGIWWRHAIHQRNVRKKLSEALEASVHVGSGVCRPFGTPGPPCIILEVNEILGRDHDALQLFQSKGGLVIQVTPMIPKAAKEVAKSFQPDYAICADGNFVLSGPNFDVWQNNSVESQVVAEVLHRAQQENLVVYVLLITANGEWHVNDENLIPNLNDWIENFPQVLNHPEPIVQPFDDGYFDANTQSPAMVYIWGGSVNDTNSRDSLEARLDDILQDVSNAFQKSVTAKHGSLGKSLLLSRNKHSKIDVLASLCDSVLHTPLGDCLVFGDNDIAAPTMLRGRWSVAPSSASSMARTAADELRNPTQSQDRERNEEFISDVLDELLKQTREVDLLRRNLMIQQSHVSSIRQHLVEEGSKAQKLEDRLEEFERFASVIERFSPGPKKTKKTLFQ